MKPTLRRRRRGAVLIVSLVCLAIVMALIGTMLVGAMRSTRQLRVERDLVQCELLLQAGLDRAARDLAASPADYAGESLDIPASEIGGSAAGRVTIDVTRTGDQPPQVRVQAEVPAGSEHSIRRSRTFRLFSSPSPSQE